MLNVPAPYRSLIYAGPNPYSVKSTPSGPISGWFGREFVLSRELCSFHARPIGAGKVNRAYLNSLLLEARTGSAIADPGVFISLQAGWAQIWTWDKERLSAGDPLNQRQIVPETAYHAPADGFALRQCLDGFEGQFWNNGALSASQWWPSLPDSDAWVRFRRSCSATSIDEKHSMPDVTAGYSHNARRLKNRVPISHAIKQFNPSEVITAGAAMLVVPLIYFGLSSALMGAELNSLRKDHERLQVSTSQLRSLNRQITMLENDNAAFLSLLRSGDPLTSLVPMFREAARRGANIISLSIDDVRIEAVFATPGELSAREVVQSLEADPFLADVSIQKQGRSQRWTVTARIEQSKVSGNE